MMRPLFLCALSVSLLALAGCNGNETLVFSQRFTLLPDTTGVGKDIPAGALALDTRTGQLCFTLAGAFQSAAPSLPLCQKLAQQTADNARRK